MHTIFKKLTSLVLALLMVITMVPVFTLTARAAEILEATFEFGENGDASHYDSTTAMKGGKEYTNNNYTLTINSPVRVYGDSRDAKGNSALKLGSSSAAGSFSFTVPENISKVVINVAGYKAKTVGINVNGTTATISTLSNNGEYTPIEVDTSSQKTVTFKTTTNYRAMIDSIMFYGDSSSSSTCEHTNTETVAEVPATCTTPGTTAGVVCSDCGEIISGCEEIAATGHTEVIDEAKAATCTATGLTEGKHCSVCNEVLVAQTVIPKTAHNYENGTCTVCGEKQPTGCTINRDSFGSAKEYAWHGWTATATTGETISGYGYIYGNTTSSIQMNSGKTGNYIYNTTPLPGSIVSITLTAAPTGTARDFYVVTSPEPFNKETNKLNPTDAEAKNVTTSGATWEFTTTDRYFAIVVTGGAAYLSSIEIIYEVCSHANTEEKAEKPATCTETGYTAGVYCNDCGTYISGHEIIEALGHSLDEGVITTAPTCTEDGVKTFTCTREGCDYSETETIEATGHTMDEGVITTAPTCTENGVKTCTCTVCGATETQPVEKLGHNWLDWKETKAPTCTETGEQTGTCSRCGETKTVKIPVTKHTYGEDGVCIDCGAIRTEATNRYYIAAQHKNDSTYYMTINLDGSSRFLAEKANLGEANELPEKITAPEANKVFVLVDNGDETYSIYAEGLTDNNYLGMPNGTGGTFVGRDEALKLSKVDNADGTCNFYYSDTKKYLSLNMQNDSSVFFGWYDDVPANNNKNLALIPVEGEAVTPAEKNPIVKWNITLQDNLKVNFHLDLNEGEQVYLKVGSAEVTYNLSDLTKTAEGYYVATVSMAAAQMMDEINVQVIDLANEKLLANKTYTIRGYADIILKGDYSDATKAMVNEMLNYGGMAQVFFGYNTENLANEGITGTGSTPVPESAKSNMNKTNDEIDGCITFYGASLVYRDKIAVRYYFDVTNAEGLKFTADGNECDAVQTGGHYMIEVPDICPQDYDTQIHVIVTNAEGHSATVSYGPMNYIVRMYKKAADAGRQDIMDLLQALYNYHLAAKAYIAAQNP